MSINGIGDGGGTGPVEFKISHSHSSNGKGKKTTPSQSQDFVEISDQTREFLKIRKLVDALPDVHLDRVNQLAKAIDEGTYNVKGEQIAEAIISKNLIDLKG